MALPSPPTQTPPALVAARVVGEGVDVRGDGSVTLGSDVIIGSRVIIHTLRGTDVNIGSRVWIGDDVEILAGVTVGDDAIVCAASRVEADVSAYALMHGNPASQMWRLR